MCLCVYAIPKTSKAGGWMGGYANIIKFTSRYNMQEKCDICIKDAGKSVKGHNKEVSKQSYPH